MNTTERRSARSRIAAPPRTAYCHGSAKRPGEGDGRAEDGADRRRSGAVEKRACSRVGAQAIEVMRADQHEEERRCERDRGGEQAAADARGGVPDNGDGLHHRTGSDLAQRDRVEEIAVGHPVIAMHGVACISGMMTNPPPYDSAPTLNATHTSDTSPPATTAAPITLEPRNSVGAKPIGLVPERLRAAPRARRAAAEQHEHEPAAPASAAATAPAARYAIQRTGLVSAPARQLAGSSPDPAWTATAATAAPAPAPRPVPRGVVRGKEHRRQHEDQAETGKDEGRAADDAPGAAADASRAVDRELGRGGSGEQVARDDRVFESSAVSQPRR